MDEQVSIPNLSLVDFPCPLCGSSSYKQLYPDTLGDQLPHFDYDFSPDHNKAYRIVFCQSCSHAYSSPRPDSLWQHYEAVEDTAYLARQKDNIATARKVLARLQQLLPKGRLLDVGCATGDFLSVAKEVYDAEGLELSSWAAEIARHRGFVVHRCELRYLQPKELYDLITLWGVIEHFEHPSREVAKMCQLLNQRGLVCLWTGDVKGLCSRLLGRKWWYVQGQHIQMFSRQSLRKLFKDNGFEEIWMGRYPCMMTMQSIAKSLGRYPVVGTTAKFLLDHPLLAERTLTLALPGEMFAIFRKV